MPATAQNSSQNNSQNPSQTRYLRFGIGLSEDHPQGMAVKKFAEIVSSKTQGRIKIELFAGGKLGNDVSMTDALRQGKLEMTAPDTSSLVRFTSGFGVINFPFLLGSEQDADALESSKYQRELIRSRNAQMVDELKKLGMKVTEIDRAELPLIRLSTRKVIDKYSKEFGEDWTKKLYLQLAMNEHAKLQRNVSR